MKCVDGMTGWSVGSRHLDPSLTRFSDIKKFNIYIYDLKPVLIWPVLGTDGIGDGYRSLKVTCHVCVPTGILGA